MRTGLSYNDVALVPKFNNVPSRTEPSLKTRLTSGIEMGIPIVNANMDTVIGEDLTGVLAAHGSVPIQHRFWKDTTTLAYILSTWPTSFISWGVGDLYPLETFLNKHGLNPIGVCLDIAHGHCRAMFDTIENIRKLGIDEIIAGNVCTAQATHDLINAGATAVKVGIGPGSVCSTRAVTGFGVPQFTAVQDCAKVANDLRVPIIADGGIKGSREIVLALAAGASSVMIGGLFAQTKEAEGKGVYRGQASREFQEDYYGQVKSGTVPEGIEIDTYDTEEGSIEDLPKAAAVIDELLGGLRSGMTYGGARSIEELQRKAEFIRVTESYMQ